jgi:predicted secreted protein
MSELKDFADPVPWQRDLRVRMDQQNKSMVGERTNYRKSVIEIADPVDRKLGGSVRHDLMPSPTGLRRNIRCDIERHNRVLAKDRDTHHREIFQKELQETKKIFDENRSMYYDPNHVRRNIRKDLDQENSIKFEGRRGRGALSKSVDYGSGGQVFLSPISLFNEHYKNEEQRKQKFRNYASDLKNDIEKIRTDRQNVMSRERRDGGSLREQFENRWVENSKKETSRKRSQQRQYAKELSMQMNENLDRRMQRLKMPSELKAINKTNLQGWKENNAAKLDAKVPGWVDNSYRRNMFQKVPKRAEDNIRKSRNNQSLGMGGV